MKEIEKIIKTDVAEIISPVQQKKEVSLGSLTLQKGHKLFEINKIDKSIDIAEFETIQVVLDEKPVVVQKGFIELFNHRKGFQTRKKLITKPDCIYIGALNKKNAIKNYNKLHDDKI